MVKCKVRKQIWGNSEEQLSLHKLNITDKGWLTNLCFLEAELALVLS